MLCTNIIYSDPVTYLHLHIGTDFFECSLYYDDLIIQIDLVVAVVVVDTLCKLSSRDTK